MMVFSLVRPPKNTNELCLVPRQFDERQKIPADSELGSIPAIILLVGTPITSGSYTFETLMTLLGACLSVT